MKSRYIYFPLRETEFLCARPSSFFAKELIFYMIYDNSNKSKFCPLNTNLLVSPSSLSMLFSSHSYLERHTFLPRLFVGGNGPRKFMRLAWGIQTAGK